MTSQEFDVTARTTPSRNRQRVSYEREAAYAVLDEANLCHVGFVVDARPVVLPQLYARVGDQLYLHASSGARAMLLAGREAADVCVTVTLVDGMVLARSAFHHSVNYRSVVVHGRATLVRDPDERLAVLTALVDAVVPGRSAYTRGPNKAELAATSVLRLPLEEASLKARSGPPNDDQEDLGLPYWAGVLPVTTLAGPPLAAPDLSPHAELPEHVSSWRPRRTSD